MQIYGFGFREFERGQRTDGRWFPTASSGCLGDDEWGFIMDLSILARAEIVLQLLPTDSYRLLVRGTLIDCQRCRSCYLRTSPDCIPCLSCCRLGVKADSVIAHRRTPFMSGITKPLTIRNLLRVLRLLRICISSVAMFLCTQFSAGVSFQNDGHA